MGAAASQPDRDQWRAEAMEQWGKMAFPRAALPEVRAGMLKLLKDMEKVPKPDDKQIEDWQFRGSKLMFDQSSPEVKTIFEEMRAGKYGYRD